MRDGHFREDENELPYLVSERRDKWSGTSEGSVDIKTNDEKLDEIVSSIYGVPEYQKFILKNKLLSFLNSKDCVRLDVDEIDLGYYLFTFTRQNRYVKTVDEFEFSKDFAELERIFIDCTSKHDYNGLMNDSRFNELLKRTPMKFERISGGYECVYSFANDEFTFMDEPEVHIIFNDRGNETAYILDLDSMNLGEKIF